MVGFYMCLCWIVHAIKNAIAAYAAVVNDVEEADVVVLDTVGEHVITMGDLVKTITVAE